MAVKDNLSGSKGIECTPTLGTSNVITGGSVTGLKPNKQYILFITLCYTGDGGWGSGNFTGTYCDGSYYCSNITMVGLVSRTDNTFSFTTNQKNGIPSIIAYGYE